MRLRRELELEDRMTVLLEMKEKIKLIYSKYEIFILPVAKFLLAFITLNTLNGRMGYMTQLDDTVIVLIAALLCSFLPLGMLVVFATLFSLAHMYALSLEVALVGFCVYLVMYLLYFRFSPKDALLVVLTPLLCGMNIPYVVPIAAGLLCGPSAIVSVSCGVVVFYLMELVISSASNLKTMGEEEMLEKIRMIIQGIIENKAMIVVIAAFVITILVVYVIRRLSIDYSWTIAILAGAMTDVAVLLVGDLVYDVNFSVGGALLGTLLAVAVAMVIQFFRFCVDYSRTEKVQFEDDEYYYYVKAVPKMAITAPTRTVKRINSQQVRGTGQNGRAAGQGEKKPAQESAAKGPGASGRTRTMTTERTSYGRNGARKSYPGTQNRGGSQRGGRSVTIGNTAESENTDNSGNITDHDNEWL